MLRGIFMTPGATKDQVNYYVDLFKKVRETPEWKKLMADGAFNQTFMTGPELHQVGRDRGKAPRRADEGGRLAGQAIVVQRQTPAVRSLRRIRRWTCARGDVEQIR